MAPGRIASEREVNGSDQHRSIIYIYIYQ